MFFNSVNFAEIERTFSNKIISIDIVLEDKNNNIDGIRNGNFVIKTVSDLYEIFDYNCKGLCVKVCGFNLDLLYLFDKYNMVIDNKYIINDNIVYECHLVNRAKNNTITMQIVCDSEEILIGIPSLLNGF